MRLRHATAACALVLPVAAALFVDPVATTLRPACPAGRSSIVNMQYNSPQVTWFLCENHACFTLRNGEQHVLGRYDAEHGVQATYDQNDPSRLRVRDKPLNPYVSRQQCVVQVATDGSASILSVGKNPTGWRAHQGAPWQWLMRNQILAITDGTQVSLDVQHPDEAVFTCWRDGGAGVQQHPRMSGYQHGFPQHGAIGGHPQQGEYPQQGGYY